MLDLISNPKHHRRRRSQTNVMDRAHHVEPLISRTLRCHTLAYFIVEDLRAATGQTVESGVLQSREDRFVVELRDQVDVVNLGRREAVQLKSRILRAQ